MKILHIINSSQVGGTERALAGLLRYAAERDISNYVMTLLTPGAMHDAYVQSAREVACLGMDRGVPSIRGLYGAIRILRRVSPDLIVTWMYQADLLAAVLTKATFGRIPVLWNLRTSATTDLVGRTAWATRSACARLSRWVPSGIVCNSPAVEQAHRSIGYDGRKMHVIPNGYDLSVFHPSDCARISVRDELRLPQETRLVGMFARLDPAKDHNSFFLAALKICSMWPDVHFVLCGEGVQAGFGKIWQAIVAAGYSWRFHFLGLRHDMARLHASLDIGVLMSSMNEGFPNSIAESMACGVPCVVSDAGGGAYVVGNCGRVVPKGDVESLVVELDQLLSYSPESRHAMGQSARSRIATMFDMNVVADRHIQLWKRLSGADAGGGAEVSDRLSGAA